MLSDCAAHRYFAIAGLVLTAVTSSFTSLAAATGGIMPAEQQNAMVQKYCAPCHSDQARNGGLTLQHFDAANVDPSLAAMLVSKLKTGALGAAGLPAPDTSVRQALVAALTSESAGSHDWTVKQTSNAVTAGILRDLPSARNAGEPVLYRLTLSCDSASGNGGMQLSWSPAPAEGVLNVSVDGRAPLPLTVRGKEKMGNGQAGATGPAAFSFPGKLNMPLRTLTVGNLFPDETVVFPFDTLPPNARASLSACFVGS